MRRAHSPGRLAAVILTLGLNACAGLPPAPPTGVDAEQLWEARRAQLDTLRRWSLVGRIAVNGGNESWSSHVRWVQRDDDYEIDFSTFLGQRVAQVTGRAGDVTLTLPGRDSVSAASAAQLLTKVFGWQMPVESLRYWVLGLPVPGEAREWSIDGLGRLQELQQDGWHVSYTEYGKGGQGLPRRFVVTHPQWRIRVVVDEWHTG
jgi:outer membrane lipoprotein LolB